VGRGEGGVGLLDGAVEVDRAGEVFEDDGLEAELGGGDGGEADAEIVGEAGKEEAGEFALAEVAGEAGGCAVVFGEGGVAVDRAAEAFAEEELGMGNLEVGVEGSAGGVLDAVIGPEVLGSVGGLDRVREGLLAGV